MPYSDLRDFLKFLEQKGQLLRIKSEIDPRLEITEVLNRLLAKGGPAVLFEKVKGHSIPVVANLFGTLERIAWGLDTTVEGLKEIGEFLAFLQHPEPPKSLVDAVKKLPLYGQVFTLAPKKVKKAPCQEVILEGKDIDLSKFPILTCWPDDAAPQITWSLVITKPPDDGPYNIGIYRMQVEGPDRTLMRWLKHHGGAKHYRAWKKAGKAMPVAVAIGTDPGMMVAAVTPVPERMSEFHFAGLLRKKAVELVSCRTIPLEVPATSEMILEGEIHPDEEAPEGPHGDHTGYYNSVEPFPVFRLKCITHRRNPYYLTTTTGRPPREDAMTGLALNIIFLPLLRQHFPEVVDFHLPMEGVSYRFAIISIKKEYPGHAKRMMMGLWGFLKQFLYVKFIIIVDDDIDVRKWEDIIWAIATRVDPVRDVTMIDHSPIDYLDFASPLPELGSKMGIDATTKIPPETNREWGKKITMDPEVVKRVDQLWKELGLN
jgi:4-hydroxy-3-polyprenylbenzoate decarboxylase